MKRLTLILFSLSLAVLSPVVARAERLSFVKEQVETAVVKNTFVGQDAFGTPLVIKWAREGNTEAL